MNYANIKYNDIANGPGTRVSLFVSGCTHHCKNCFNQEAWPFDAGKPFTTGPMLEIFEACRPDHVHGLSILGGEPFELANQKDVENLVYLFHRYYPKKSIWMWSGYTWEQITGLHEIHTVFTDSILAHIDVLVDGEYVEALHDVNLRFRGSSNQRIIDVKKSLHNGNKVVLWEDESLFASHQWKENPHDT